MFQEIIFFFAQYSGPVLKKKDAYQKQSKESSGKFLNARLMYTPKIYFYAYCQVLRFWECNTD